MREALIDIFFLITQYMLQYIIIISKCDKEEKCYYTERCIHPLVELRSFNYSLS